MPQIVVEVLVLELRVMVPSDWERAASRDSAIIDAGPPDSVDEAFVKLDRGGFFCEVAPAWDHFWAGKGGDYYCTSSSAPDDDGRMVWFGDPAATHFLEWSKAEVAERLEPLVAFLVDLPPPGAVANLAGQRLGVAIKPTGAAASLMPGQDVEVPLRPLCYARPGQPVHLCVQAEDGRASVGMLAAWVPAPKGIQRLVRQPTLEELPAEEVEPPAESEPPSGVAAPANRGRVETSPAGRRQTENPSEAQDSPRSPSCSSPRGAPPEEEPEPGQCAGETALAVRPRGFGGDTSPRSPSSPSSPSDADWPPFLWQVGRRGDVMKDAQALIECTSARVSELEDKSESLSQAIRGFQRRSRAAAKWRPDSAEDEGVVRICNGETNCAQDIAIAASPRRRIRSRPLYEPVLKSATLRQRTAASGGALQAARALRSPRF